MHTHVSFLAVSVGIFMECAHLNVLYVGVCVCACALERLDAMVAHWILLHKHVCFIFPLIYTFRPKPVPTHASLSHLVSSSPGWNPTKHWLAVTSILLIVGAVGVAVPLALRVADGECL